MRHAVLCLVVMLFACIPHPTNAAPPPNSIPAFPLCLKPIWEDLEAMAESEAVRIASGRVVALEGDISKMNDPDMDAIRAATTWGLLERMRLEGRVNSCGMLASDWAKLRFQAALLRPTSIATGHGLNALRKVTAGWGPLPLERAAHPREGDARQVLEYMSAVLSAQLDPGGPYSIGPNRWVPPAFP